MNKKYLTISAFLAAMLLLSACNGSKSTVPGTEAGTKPGTAPETEAETVPETIPETEGETEPEIVTLAKEFDGGIKLYSNGVLDFGETIYDDEGNRIVKFINKTWNWEIVVGVKKLVVGPLEIRINGNHNYGLVGCVLNSISAYGHTYTFESKTFYEQIPLLYDNGLQLFEIDGRIVFAQLDRTVGMDEVAASTTFILQKDGIYQIKNETPAGVMDYNCPNITLYKTYDGCLHYRRLLEKYFVSKELGGEPEYCTSRNEFCCEYGSVSFDGMTPVYTVEKTESVSAHFNIEKLYREWKVTKQLPYATLNEYLAHNAEIYQRGY